jgi:ribonuclease Z
MSMQVVFLGTSASVPTPKRSLPGILVKREDERFMFDCGENTQRQMMIARTGFHKKMKIFITHMHGDHVLGLPGLLQTMALLNRTRDLDIYGTPGIERFLTDMKETVQFGLTFTVKIHEIAEPGIICDEEQYTVEAVKSNHVINSLAYALAEKSKPGRFYPKKAKVLGIKEGPLWSELQKGKNVILPNGRTVKPEDVMGPSRNGRKIVYTGDTRPFKDLAEFASDADLLINDCTLADDLAERAEEDGHSTPSQAAENAKKAKVKKLVLTHISARYDDTTPLLKQAKKIFKNTVVAEDFFRIELQAPKD